jgi:hypothetical protein
MKSKANLIFPTSHSRNSSEPLSNTILNSIIKPKDKPSKQRLTANSRSNIKASTEFPVENLVEEKRPKRVIGPGMEEVEVKQEVESKRERSKRTIKRSDKFGPDFVCLDDVKRYRKRRVPEEDSKEKPVKRQRAHKKTYQPMVQCKKYRSLSKSKHVRASKGFKELVSLYSQCRDSFKKRKEEESKTMSPLELLILAVENDSKEAGKRMNLSEGKESITLQSDCEKSWEEVRGITGHFNIQHKDHLSIKSFLHNTLLHQHLK